MSERPILSLAALEAFDVGVPHGNRRRFCCPLCGADKPHDAAHRSLSVESASGLWKCFRCNASGRLREFWPAREPRSTGADERNRLQNAFALPQSEALPTARKSARFAHNTQVVDQANSRGSGIDSNFDFGEIGENRVDKSARSDMRASLSISRSNPDQDAGADKWRELWSGAVALADAPGAAYLARRGITAAASAAAEVRFHRHWPGGAAIVFPICDRAGEIVAVQGRAVRGVAKRTYGPKKLGVFAAPVFLSSGRALGPLQAEAIVITEAPIDALSLSSCGFPALALCGTSGPDWLHLACGLRRVVLALDDDEAGQNASRALRAFLSPYGARCYRLLPPGAKDWNEALTGQGRDALTDWLALHLLSEHLLSENW